MTRPLFQGYLFVELHRGQGWVDILHTPGVRDLVRRAGDRDLPALLEPELIAEIYAKSEAGDFDERPIKGVTLRAKPGDSMRVTEGPFASFFAELREVDQRGRVQTLMRFFNRQVPANFHLHALEEVSA